MTKEDKQIIKRATKESWRIGDRSHLKRLLEKNLKLYRENKELELELTVQKDLLQEETNLHLHAEEYIKSLEKENAELKQQIEKMKCCSNCKHFNNVDDLEYCQNCERHLVNSLDKLPREEIIKDEWELKE